MHTLADLIERNARFHGARLAVVSEGRRYTHGEHARRIWKLAHALLALGLAHGDRVAILSHNRSEVLEAFGAAECAGLVATPFNWRLSARELVRNAQDCLPSVLFHDAANAAAAAEIAGAVPGLRRIVIGTDYEALLQARTEAAPPAQRPAPGDVADIIYTSGTTGVPKGVQWSHGALLRSAQTIAGQAGERPTDRLIVVMPLFHVGARIEWLSLQSMGGAAIVLPAFSPTAFFEAVQAERATMAHLAPVMVNLLVDDPARTGYDLTSLRDIHYGSAPVPEAGLRKAVAAFGPVFTQLYGMTEHLLSSMLLPYQQVLDGTPRDQRRLRSAGQPYPGTELRIVDDAMRDLPPGQVGELAVRSGAMMSGYFNRPDATREVLRDGWLLTGDLASLDEDGFLYIVDRKKDMVISGGENIYCREVEEVILLHPQVRDAAVIGVPDAKWGEAVKAFVIARDGAPLTAQQVIDHCRANLASYKRPQTVEFMPEFPRLPHGKVDKKELRKPYWEGVGRGVA
jgi:acyl-CoA synthetase (AMP-forming)/AMP-acid ligase II